MEEKHFWDVRSRDVAQLQATYMCIKPAQEREKNTNQAKERSKHYGLPTDKGKATVTDTVDYKNKMQQLLIDRSF